MNIKKTVTYELGKCKYIIRTLSHEDKSRDIEIDLTVEERTLSISYNVTRFGCSPNAGVNDMYYFWDFYKIGNNKYWDVSNILGDGHRLTDEHEIKKILNYFSDGFPEADKFKDGFMNKNYVA